MRLDINKEQNFEWRCLNERANTFEVGPACCAAFIRCRCHSLCQLAFAQGRPTEDSASFKNVKETASKLLLEPIYTAADERLLNEAGDSAALAIAKIVSEQEMNAPETGRRILLILHLAFEALQSIIDRSNKTPNVALRLLTQLERLSMAFSVLHRWEGRNRLVLDNPTAAKTALDNARPSARRRKSEDELGEANININYAYCGLEPGTNTPLVFFGVNEVAQAAPLLEQADRRYQDIEF
jgi:hypothetical protein